MDFFATLKEVLDPLSLGGLIVSQEARNIFCLWIWPVGKVISGIINLLLSGCVNLAIRVFRGSPGAVRFNAEKILPSENSEEATFSPKFSP